MREVVAGIRPIPAREMSGGVVSSYICGRPSNTLYQTPIFTPCEAYLVPRDPAIANPKKLAAGGLDGGKRGLSRIAPGIRPPPIFIILPPLGLAYSAAPGTVHIHRVPVPFASLSLFFFSCLNREADY